MPTQAQIKKLRTKRDPGYKIIREALRHYAEYRHHFRAHGQIGDVFSHTYIVYNDDAEPQEKVTVTLCYSDLLRCAKQLPQKKREALWYNIVLDKSNDEVASIMKCQTQTISQYVRSACEFLAEGYWNEGTEKIEVLV
jgi:DNA-directed RNA polymerase specialized sigma24 family protein